MGRFLHRVFRRVGIGLQRFRDPYDEMKKCLSLIDVQTVIDGGAYKGTATTRLLSLFPACTVHAFEPQQDSFELVADHFKNEPRVRVHGQALSDECGTATFHINEQAFTSSLLATNQPDLMRPKGIASVETTTIDTWSAAEGCVPEVIKLDLQGHELAALRGGAATLGRGVQAVLIEVNFQRRYENACVYHEVATLLDAHGFQLHRFYEIVADGNGRLRHADALFLRKAD